MAQLLLEHFTLCGTAQRAHGVLDQFVGAARLASAETAGARRTRDQTQDALLAAIVEGEGENSTIGCDLGPIPLRAAALQSIESVSRSPTTSAAP